MKILFLCVGNSARSQIAEALLNEMRPSWEIRSAGSKPSRINPYTIEVLMEVNIDIATKESKSVSDLPIDFIKNLDFIITLCNEEICPVIQSKAQKIHWPFPDPVTSDKISDTEALARFRQVRENIKNKIQIFIKDKT